MKTAELFCGTKSFSKVAKELGHKTFTIDNDEQFNPDVRNDIRKIKMIDHVDILWASPPCQGFSVAAIGHNWGGGKNAYIPKSDTAKLGIELVKSTLRLIKKSKPTWFFIENPRGVLRKLPLLQHLRRITVSYCQYGDTRMKPTDIWTNVPPEIWTPRPCCRNGDTCHVSAPRGSKTGTQGIKGARDRGVIPRELFVEIFNALTTPHGETRD